MLSLLLPVHAFGPAHSVTDDDLSIPEPPMVTSPSPDADFTTRVVGGDPAFISDWPSTVMLIADGAYQTCTGTLIDTDIVLTAAHCVTDGINITHIISGATDVLTGGNWVPVVQQHVHPSYTAFGGSDIAVLELQHDSPDPPITIASECIADSLLVDGTPAAIVGYGAISHDGTTGTTRVYEAFSTLTDADCSEDYVAGHPTTCDPNLRAGARELFAGGGGVDACFGDSGGPIYVQDSAGTWYVAGATSRGAAGVFGACGGGGVWVRPDAHLSWIEASIARTLPRPTCGTPPPPEPAPQPEPEPEPEPEPQPEPEPDPQPEPQPDPETDTPTDPGTPPAPETPDETVEDAVGAWEIHGGTLVVARDTLGALQLDIETEGDPELEFEVARDGWQGSAQAYSDGLVLYRPDQGATGDDRVVLEVTDAEGRVQEVDIDVLIYRDRGCSTGSNAPAWGGLLAGLLALCTRRRR